MKVAPKLQPLVAFAVSVILWFFAFVGTAFVLGIVRRNPCPAESFFTRVSLDTVVLMSLPLALALMGAGVLLTGYYPGFLTDRPHKQAIVTLLAAAMLCCYPAGIWLGRGNALCLTTAGIIMRDNTLSPERRYLWGDVKGMRIVCATHGVRHRHKIAGVQFVLSDTNSFWMNPQEYGAQFGNLSVALRDIPYGFDGSDVDNTCSTAEMATLIRLPNSSPR